MDEKEFNKQTEANRKAREEMHAQRRTMDSCMHSESKTWTYDHKTGTLKSVKVK